MKDYKKINNINELIKFILNEKNIEEDSDAVVYAAEKLSRIATRDDLPVLFEELEHANNPFHRETFADPIAKITGANSLEKLFEAAVKSAEQGSDNDFMYTIIDGVLDEHTEESKQILQEIIDKSENKKIKDMARDALEHISEKEKKKD